MIGALRRRLVERFWSRRFRQTTGRGEILRTWMHEPLVRRAINRRITGDEHCWPMDWFVRQWCTHNGAFQPFDRGLSLGCGDGHLERDVMSKGICRSLLGIDLSTEAVAQANRAAAEAGFETLEYRRGDMNQLDLGDERFDIVFFHQSLHHVAELETCLDEVRRVLKPGGILYLDELIGPSRDTWQRSMLADAESAFERLPRHLQRRQKLDMPVDWRDPSEAIRSGEIVEQVGQRFEVLERRDYGGHLLAIIHPFLDPEALKTPEGEEALASLVAEEDSLLEAGRGSFYAVMVAR